jgi:hypothetical protein
MSETEEVAMDSLYVAGSVTPGFVDGQEWAACFGLSWTDLLLRDQASSQRIIREGGQYVRKVAGTMGVAAARNEISRYFLEHTNAEWLWMVDTDMGFAPDTVDRMVASAEANGADVLGALCFAQKLDTQMKPGEFHATRLRIQPTLYEMVQVEGTEEIGFKSIRYQRDAFQAVAATGAACLLIHRNVLAGLGPDPFAPLAIPGAGGNGTARTFSEDLSFCVRATAAGAQIGVDTSIKTTHYKGGIFLDETMYAMQEETLIQAAGHAIAHNAQEWIRNGAQGKAPGLFVPGRR